MGAGVSTRAHPRRRQRPSKPRRSWCEDEDTNSSVSSVSSSSEDDDVVNRTQGEVSFREAALQAAIISSDDAALQAAITASLSIQAQQPLANPHTNVSTDRQNPLQTQAQGRETEAGARLDTESVETTYDESSLAGTSPAACKELTSMSDGSNSATCVVCWSAPKNCVVLPCKHMATCAECTKAVWSSTKRCPICRAHISECIYNVYL
mmetsp:Transcript_23625/g.51567  ORF Transcript_23625/g.51567 Transcript_23625/m.51567 type:complete len:208 (+) Transcript_23625:179-802(+)